MDNVNVAILKQIWISVSIYARILKENLCSSSFCDPLVPRRRDSDTSVKTREDRS